MTLKRHNRRTMTTEAWIGFIIAGVFIAGVVILTVLGVV